MLTNVYGHFVLAAALMPLIKAADKARIVTQSSGARFQAIPVGGPSLLTFGRSLHHTIQPA